MRKYTNVWFVGTLVTFVGKFNILLETSNINLWQFYKVFYEDHKKSIEIQSVSDQRNVSHASNGYKCDHCNNIFVEEDAIKHQKQNCVPANDYKRKAAEKSS